MASHLNATHILPSFLFLLFTFSTISSKNVNATPEKNQPETTKNHDIKIVTRRDQEQPFPEFPLIATMKIDPSGKKYYYPEEISRFSIIADRESQSNGEVSTERIITMVIDHPDDLQRMTEKYTIDIVANDQSSFEEGDVSESCYRSVGETYRTMSELVSNDSHNLTSIKNIGQSYLKKVTGGKWGYDMKVLTITSPDRPVEQKSHFFAMFGIHPREFAPPELGLRFAEHLLSEYPKSADIHQILDQTVIHLLLEANPDGRNVVETDHKLESMRRKNMNFEAGACGIKSGLGGIDLNRNFDFAFAYDNQGSSNNPCSQSYRGVAAESEPEIKALTDYVRGVYQRAGKTAEERELMERELDENTSGLFFDIHSFGGMIIWPFVFENQKTKNHDDFEVMASKLSEFNGFKFAAPGPDFWYPANGNTCDWAYGKIGVPALGMELGTAFKPTCHEFNDEIFPRNLPLFLYAAKTTKAPFRLSKGPDVTGITLSKDRVTIGDENKVDIQATVKVNNKNKKSSNNAISFVELFVDEHPHDVDTNNDGGVRRGRRLKGLKMEYIGGAGNLSLDVSGLEEGRHILNMRAVDGDGYDGPVSSVFLFVDKITKDD